MTAFGSAQPATRGDVTDCLFEPAEVDGLGQVGVEPRIGTPLEVLFHSVAGQGDPWDRPTHAELCNSSRPLPSGRPMSLTTRSKGPSAASASKAAPRLEAVATRCRRSTEYVRHDLERIGVIFHE